MGPDRNSYAKTDKSATFMHMKEDHMRNSQLKPGYNIQIGVADEYILHMDIYQDRSDYKTFIPFLEGFKQSYGYYPKYPVADTGYGGLVNYMYLKLNHMELFQKYTMYSKDTHDKKRMNDTYFSLNLIKEGDDFKSPNGDVLKYFHKNKRVMKFTNYRMGNKKRLIMKILSTKEVIKNLKSPLGIDLRNQRSIQVEVHLELLKKRLM